MARSCRGKKTGPEEEEKPDEEEKQAGTGGEQESPGAPEWNLPLGFRPGSITGGSTWITSGGDWGRKVRLSSPLPARNKPGEPQSRERRMREVRGVPRPQAELPLVASPEEGMK